MEHAWIVSGGQPITPEHLPDMVRRGPNMPTFTPRLAGTAPAPLPPPPSAGGSLETVEMEHILRVLEKHNGNKASAANELGISLKTLYNKMNKYEAQRQAAAG